MNEITRSDYYREVRSLAATILADVREESPGATEDERHEALQERLWETVDGHEWVVYTYKAQQVVAHSDNDGYSAENFGAESIVDESGRIKWEAIAFGALFADVSDVLWALDWKPEDDPSGDEEATR